ncbi:polyadenylation factor I subunit 2 [Scheffersomyces coipomensis]|uniref:polyadenylation factor I subunit 2 n=1 Tax=Scheffersomyces coipomensis TaxID=1788519 RepID=UPI00315D04C5
MSDHYGNGNHNGYNNNNNNHHHNNNYNNNDRGGGGRYNNNRAPKEGKDSERLAAYKQNLDQQLASQEKKTAFRRIVDHGNNMGRWYINKSLGLTRNQQPIGKIRPDSSYLIDLLPSMAYSSSSNLDCNSNRNNMAIMDIETKFVHLSSNKVKHSINTVKWTPEGRRLVVASHSGEFTIWNGMTFNFETIMQAHDSPILSLQYSHNDEWLLSGDQSGGVKFWQPNFNNVNNITAHPSGVRDIAFSPNDSKFLTCGDDSTVKIWNFNNGQEERTLTGHHWEVKSADWHANLGLIVSGSKDNLVKLWDPRSSTCVTTLHGFKHTVNKTRFQPTGTKRLLAAVSRDRSCRIFDLRTMKDILVLRDHETDLSCVAWHPVHASMLTTAAFNGAMNQYLLDSYIPDNDNSSSNTNSTNNNNNNNNNNNYRNKNDNFKSIDSLEAVHKIPFAHEKAIHTLEYHPMGHLLCSAGSDKTARFWSRARPNDPKSYKDAVYTDQKNGAWYYVANNNVNAIIEDEESKLTTSSISGNAPLPPPTTQYANASSSLNSLSESRSGGINVPGLNNVTIPGLNYNR